MGCELYQATYYLAEDLLAAPLPADNGVVKVPSGSRLGLDFNEDRLARYNVERLG